MEDLFMKIAVVIPAYKCKKHILNVISLIDQSVTTIYVVDDACPDYTGKFVQENCKDSRVKVLLNSTNSGVGGAVLRGYKEALKDGMTIAVKIDGDGQMDPKLLPKFTAPIISEIADYTKGNRFTRVDHVKKMPGIRIFGNASLSLISKISSGYWKIFDPTNGYTALNLSLLDFIEIDKVSQRYFFESDLLFRLGLARAVVLDIPMESKYEDEVSNLKISNVTFEFALKHLRNFAKRIIYQYFILDLNIASIELIIGTFFLLFGIVYGVSSWVHSYLNNILTSTGEIMLAALPIILGFQLILNFISFDIGKEPTIPLNRVL